MPIEEPEQFLYDSGLVFHINRAILHPLGLSLSIIQKEVLGETISGFEIHETDNENGFVINDDELRNLNNKLEDFLATRRTRVLTRAKNLGYIMQTVANDKP